MKMYEESYRLKYKEAKNILGAIYPLLKNVQIISAKDEDSIWDIPLEFAGMRAMESESEGNKRTQGAVISLITQITKDVERLKSEIHQLQFQEGEDGNV